VLSRPCTKGLDIRVGEESATDLEPGALQPGITRAELMKAIEGHTKGAAVIIATFALRGSDIGP
jgi:hypothetical protein